MFLPYLEEWETSVNAREGFSGAEKRMLLSSEAILGLRRTSKIHVICVVSFFH